MKTIGRCLAALPAAIPAVTAQVASAEEPAPSTPYQRVQAEGSSAYDAESDFSGGLTPEEMIESWDQTLESLLNIGPFDLKPAAGYRFKHSDNIFAGSSAAKIDDFIHEITPELGVEWSGADELGSGVRRRPAFETRYAPTFRYFHDNTNQNNIDHRANARYFKEFRRVTLNASANYADTREIVIQGGGRSDREVYGASLDAVYDLTGKTDLEAGVGYTVNNYQNLIDSEILRNMNWLRYNYSPKVALSLGAGVGRSDSSGRSAFSFTSEEVQARLQYFASAKLSVSINGGAQFVQFSGTDAAANDVYPVFSAGLAWIARANTLVGVNASRSIAPSNFVENRADATTSFSARINQKIAQKVDLGLVAGAGFQDFENVTARASNVRSQEYYFATLSAGYNFARRASASIFYSFQDRTGNRLINESTINEIGLGVSYRF